MATALGEIALIGANTLISILNSSSIAGINIQAMIQETHDDTLEATDHPVEDGAAITDHAYVKPTQVVLRCGWSNSRPAALISTVGSLFSAQPSDSSTNFASTYVGGIYSQLVTLQQSRQLIIISTPLRTYDSMLMTSLNVIRDQKTSFALMVVATFKELITVSSQTTTIPPQANQASPADTSAMQSIGVMQLQPGSPSPGGSLPPSSWGTTNISGRSVDPGDFIAPNN